MNTPLGFPPEVTQSGDGCGGRESIASPVFPLHSSFEQYANRGLPVMHAHAETSRLGNRRKVLESEGVQAGKGRSRV